MLKSLSLLSVVGVGLLLVAGATADDPAKGCAGGAGSKATSPTATAKSCAGCPSQTIATSATVKQADESAACAKSCEGCPAAAATSATACAKSCEGCPAATATSATAGAAGCDKCPLTAATKETSAGCAGGACPTTATSADCKDCPIAAAMKALPQMTYMVGEEKTCCPKAAAELAQKSSAAIRYTVGDKTFDKEAEAKAALVESTEQFVAAFAEPKVCKESGKITVAGKEQSCSQTAAATAAVAKAAMDKVQLTYLVGEKECHCPNEAAKVAEESGQPTVFVVAGQSTGCSVSARLNLAIAKYKAAVAAVTAEASAQTEKLTSKDS